MVLSGISYINLYIPAQLRRRALFLAEYQTYPEKSRFLTLEQRYFSRNNHQAIQDQHTFLHVIPIPIEFFRLSAGK